MPDLTPGQHAEKVRRSLPTKGATAEEVQASLAALLARAKRTEQAEAELETMREMYRRAGKQADDACALLTQAEKVNVHLDPSSNFHPFECDGPGKCIHCDRTLTYRGEGPERRTKLATIEDAKWEIDHDPETCALCEALNPGDGEA